jgi:hypothetical protein
MTNLLDISYLVQLTLPLGEWEDKTVTMSEDTYNLVGLLLALAEDLELWSYCEEELNEVDMAFLRGLLAKAYWEVTQYD